jgi:uncharacterized protein
MSIPAQVTVSTALTRAAHYEGHLDLSHLPRLRDMELRLLEGVDASAGFREESGRWLEVWAEGVLELQCQRCLQGFPWRFGLDSRLRLVSSEAEESAVIADSEPCHVKDDRLALREVIEDEILLALPMVARCETCKAPTSAGVEKVVEDRVSPFAGLKNLKR